MPPPKTEKTALPDSRFDRFPQSQQLIIAGQPEVKRRDLLHLSTFGRLLK